MKDTIKNIAIIKIQALAVFCLNLISITFTSEVLENLNLWLQLFLTGLQIMIAILSAIILIRGKLKDLFNFGQTSSNAKSKGL